MKCLPRSRIAAAKGRVLHDWHAEVLAKRAFNRWILGQCETLARRRAMGKGRAGAGKSGCRESQGLDNVGASRPECDECDVQDNRADEGEWVRWRCSAERRQDRPQGPSPPFALRDDVTLHLYASDAPCGDASMELVMAAQEDATPWSQQPKSSSPVADDLNEKDDVHDESGGMLGRGHFDRLGEVRRKPSRPDAPASWSKSCSDKMAMWQCTGLLSGLVAKVLSPGNVYLDTVVLPEDRVVQKAVGRAFSTRGRMADVAGLSAGWAESGYAFKGFEVRGTQQDFEYEKGAVEQATGEKAVASNLSVVWTPEKTEVLINGVLQGRRQGDARGASGVSRREMWQAIVDLAALADEEQLVGQLSEGSYQAAKAEVGRDAVKRDVKSVALRGWRRNAGDEDWPLIDE